MRIVSLACSNTEIVHALGCEDMLVGVDDHSDWPTEVVDPLPKVGPDLEIDIGRVAELEPDLVLATLTVPGHERVVAGLEEAGLPFIAPEPVSLDDVYRDIHRIADSLGVPERAEGVVRSMRAEIGSPPTRVDGPSILVQWWPQPVIAPGRLSWVHDVLAASGATHPLAGEEVKSRPMEDEEVAELDPDAFVVSWCGVDPGKYRPEVILEKPEWQDLRAVKNGHVFCVPEAHLGRPGPRLLEGVRALRGITAWVASAQAGAPVH